MTESRADGASAWEPEARAEPGAGPHPVPEDVPSFLSLFRSCAATVTNCAAPRMGTLAFRRPHPVGGGGQMAPGHLDLGCVLGGRQLCVSSRRPVCVTWTSSTPCNLQFPFCKVETEHTPSLRDGGDHVRGAHVT